jgi:two-component system, NtrC family, sensor kinase
MFSALRQSPIKRKLMLVILLSCAVAIIAGSLVEASLRLYTARKGFAASVGTLARVIAANTAEAITLNDAKTAQSVLSTLRENDAVVSATVQLPDGQPLCRFGVPDELPAGNRRLLSARSEIHGLMVRHTQPIKLDGETLGTLHIRADFGPELRHAMGFDLIIFASILCISSTLAILVSNRLQNSISGPIRALAQTAAAVAAQNDYSLRAKKFAPDEVGALTDVFNYMLDEIQRQHTELRREISERVRVEQEVDKLHKQVLSATRQAGMAEVATGVLHNVGNVLNSVNISTALLAEHLEKSRAANVGRLGQLLRSHSADLAGFLTTDPKGRALPEYIAELGQRLDAERLKMHGELQGLTANIEHIKEIVAMQQSYAKVSGETESLSIADLIEDAIRMNAAAFVRHGVSLQKELTPVPFVSVDKHKVLQILINLLRNAKYAVDDTPHPKRIIRIGTHVEGRGFVAITVADNGVGIAPENLTRIFAHGFTTRKEGHGFGLHSGALAAKEMGGALSVQSDGPGRGATFTLTVPIAYDLVMSPGTNVCPPPAPQLISAS